MIVFDAVSKTYRSGWRRRSLTAVDGLSLEIHAGEIFGIAGPNGAGKSTLINMLLGFLRPSGGHISVGGLEPRAWVETHGVGYLSELVAIPPTWNVRRTLDRYAVLADVPPGDRAARVRAAITMLGLEEHEHKRVKQLSKGNLQRLGLAQALLSESDVVILDEPTHGFDPLWTQRFRDIARDLKRPGRAVLIASHNLDELERVADRVAIIDRGRLQRIAIIGEGSATATMTYRLVLSKASDGVAAAFAGATVVADGKGSEHLLPAVDLTTLNAGLRRLIEGGHEIVAVVPERSRLEAAFREAVGVRQ